MQATIQDQFRDDYVEELHNQAVYEFSSINHHSVDIIIVVHNQLNYIRNCIESLYRNTASFMLYLWDNGSDKPTADYLKQIAKENGNIYLERIEENIGFIKPNNILAAKGNSPYLILLNSDTEVHKGWESSLVGWLENKSEYAITGYLGGLLENDGKGGKVWWGELIDYVCGWCLCISRRIYNQFGLFDDVNLEFAYGEDADLSLRILTAGYKIRALRLGFVTHYGNATIAEVAQTRDCKKTFDQNHEYLKIKWKNYLETDRILLKKQFCN